jgi:hypothetical protein
MDSFKMIDGISLVEYSDEKTADSEQLESFRKFCEAQNSEGVQESTPSASNTESAYLADIHGGFNQEILINWRRFPRAGWGKDRRRPEISPRDRTSLGKRRNQEDYSGATGHDGPFGVLGASERQLARGWWSGEAHHEGGHLG